MARSLWMALALAGAAGVLCAQTRTARLDVQHYAIEADVDPQSQTLNAKARITFVPDTETSSAPFELNNALNVSKVEDESGRQIAASRQHQNYTVLLNFATPLPAGKPATVVFTYDGRLTGNEDSPVFGIKFAAIHPDYGYLLYPARWFPVSGYTTDRFTADLKVTVPAGFKVLGPATATAEPVVSAPAAAPAGQRTALTAAREPTGGDRVQYAFSFKQPAFPGSVAVVKSEPVHASSEGVGSDLYFRDDAAGMAAAYGQEAGKVFSYLTSLYGPIADPDGKQMVRLTFVQTEDGAANGYSAPGGLMFMSPQGIGKQTNLRLLANQIARQWWTGLLSPSTRGGLWITNGMARYAELMYLEHTNGPSAIEAEAKDLYIDALTNNDVPLAQAGRLEDYSPEFWSVTASKGAAVYNMLRYVMGDPKFQQLLRDFPAKFQWKSVKTDDIEQMASAAYGDKLNWFFLEWVDSSGAPEFKLEYTTYRVSKGPNTQGGFRAMGKVTQDLDTFRMPVDLRVETEGNPEEKRIEVTGTSTEFSVDTFGKPKSLILDPNNKVLRFSDPIRVQVAIRRGEQFAEVGEYNEALKEYQKALEVNRSSSLAHYRIAEVFFLQNNYQAAANEFREALNGNLDPKWTEVWAHINLGKIFDITSQRDRAVNEYTQAIRTKDNTQGAQEVAAQYLKTPYERKRVDQ